VKRSIIRLPPMFCFALGCDVFDIQFKKYWAKRIYLCEVTIASVFYVDLIRIKTCVEYLV
jgi:hypothetical protein